MTSKSVIYGFALACLATAAQAASSGCTFEPRIPTTRYEINGNEVYDTQTNLTWQRCSVGQAWEEGVGCTGTPDSLSITDAKRTPRSWRLPTKEELDGLLSNACLRSVNSEAFPGISLANPTFWSSSETEPGLTWTVNLTSGAEFNALQSSTNAAKLVRTGR